MAAWEDIQELAARAPLAEGYRFALLERAEIRKLIGFVETWFPDIRVGSASCYLRTQFYAKKVHFEGERDRDVLVLGQTHAAFRAETQATLPRTLGGTPPPELTRRERDVLVALCRPLFSDHAFAEPATTRAIAAELVVTDAAVQQHLLRLYAKFDLHDGPRRRVLLANEAIRALLSKSDQR